MTNLLSGLLSLLSTGNAPSTPASGGRTLKSGTNPDFEQVLQQAQQQSQEETSAANALDPSKTDASLNGQPAAAVNAVVSKTEMVLESFRLSIEASSLKDGMAQVEKLLQDLSALSIERGTALVTSLSSGKIDASQARDFVKTLKDILLSAAAQGVNPLASSSLSTQWLTGLQQDPEAMASLTQALQTGNSSEKSATPVNPWAGFSISTVSSDGSETDILQTASWNLPLEAKAQTASRVQLPSDWKVSFGSGALSETAQTSLRSLVNLLVQSDAGKVILSQAVAYEIGLKITAQMNASKNGVATTIGAAGAAPAGISVLETENRLVVATEKRVGGAEAIQKLPTDSVPVQPEKTVSPVGSEVRPISSATVNENPTPLPARDGWLKVETVLPPVSTSPAPGTPSTVPPQGDSLEKTMLSLPSAEAEQQTKSLPTAPISQEAAARASWVGPASEQQTIPVMASPRLNENAGPIVTLTSQDPTGTPSSTTTPVGPVTTVKAALSVGTGQSEDEQPAAGSREAARNELKGLIPNGESGPSAQQAASSATDVKDDGTVSNEPVTAGRVKTSESAAGVTPAITKTAHASANSFNQFKSENTVPSEKMGFSKEVSKEPDLKVVTSGGTGDHGNAYLVAASTGSEILVASSQTSKAAESQAANIVQQVVQQVAIENVTARSVSHLSFQLVPENLGKVTVQVALVDQVVTAKIFVTHAEVREVLQNHLVELKTSLYQAGLQIDQLQVQVQGGGAGLLAQYYQYQQEGYGSGSGSSRTTNPPKNTEIPVVSGASLIGSNNVNLLV